MEKQNEIISRSTRVGCLVLSCYRIHRFKETKDCSQEGIKEKQQNSNGFHLVRITRYDKRQIGTIFIIQRNLG
jgi:hypothetical protein